MPILVSKTFSNWDYAALEAGETDDRGFEYENQPFTFRELVEELRGYTEQSSYPLGCRPIQYDWVSQSSENYRTGEQTETSLHFGKGNTQRKVKYWEKALRKAGFKFL